MARARGRCRAAEDRQSDRASLPTAERQRDLRRAAMTGDRSKRQRALIERADDITGRFSIKAIHGVIGMTIAVSGGTSCSKRFGSRRGQGETRNIIGRYARGAGEALRDIVGEARLMCVIQGPRLCQISAPCRTR